MLCPGKWTVQQAAELSVPAPTIEAALDGRFLSGLKDQRVKAAKFFKSLGATEPTQQPVSCPAPDLHLPHSVQLGSTTPQTVTHACAAWDDTMGLDGMIEAVLRAVQSAWRVRTKH